MAEGSIKKLTDKGFGFINVGGGKDLFFHHHVLHSGFDDHFNAVERHTLMRDADAVHGIARGFLREHSMLDAFVVELADSGEAGGEVVGLGVAQQNMDTTRGEPLRDARAHDARSDDGDIGDAFGRNVCECCGNAWTVRADEIPDAKELLRTSVPYFRRWGCLIFVLLVLAAIASSLGILILSDRVPIQ